MEEKKQTSVKKKPSKSKNFNLTIEEWIQKMKIGFGNARLGNIQSTMVNYGYNPDKLNELLGEVEKLEKYQQSQKKKRAEQFASTDEFDKKRKEVNVIYMRHFKLCKVLFRNDVIVGKLLDFNGKRKTTYSDWYYQVSNFYAQILNYTVILEKMKTINIQEEEIKEVIKELKDLSDLKETQKRKTAEAQKATEIRDQAFDDLYPMYSDFISYAKVALPKQQELEALGIVVKR